MVFAFWREVHCGRAVMRSRVSNGSLLPSLGIWCLGRIDEEQHGTGMAAAPLRVMLIEGPMPSGRCSLRENREISLGRFSSFKAVRIGKTRSRSR